MVIAHAADMDGGGGPKGKLPGYGYVGPIDALSSTSAYMALGRLGVLFSTDGGGTWQPTSTTTVGGAVRLVAFVDATRRLGLLFSPWIVENSWRICLDAA